MGGEGAGIGRAVWFAAARRAELRTHQVSKPGPGEVLVQGLCSLISPGTEMLVYRGQVRSDQRLGVPTAEGSFAFPIKYGYQVVGRVVESGTNAGAQPGQLVFVRHPHQSLFTVPEGGGVVTLVPPEVDETSAMFANLVDVAVNCLFDVPVRFGDVVAVQGLGMVGLFCSLLAARTSSAIVGVDPVPERRARAERQGVPLTASPEEAPALIRELSDGRGADICIEASGTAAGLQAAIDGTGQEGTIVVVAFYGTKHLDLVPGDAFHVRRQRIVSTNVVHIGSGLQPRWDRARRFDVSMHLTPSLKVDALITHRFRLDDAPAAYELVDAGEPGTFGVVLDLST